MNYLSERLLSLLRKVDTPTVCNSIEMAQGKRGGIKFTHQTVQIAKPDLPSLVGYARTARIKASAPPSTPQDEVDERRRGYYRYMLEGVRPAVCVIEDVDFPTTVGAFWGEINTWIHQSFDIGGVLTNGIMRDLKDLAPDFQVIAGSIGPSHGFVHVLDYDQPVTVFGLEVNPGDLIHADQHGSVIIPGDVIGVLEENIKKLISTEKIILDAAKEGRFTLEKFEKVWKSYSNARV